jgi:hypothetical protein
MFLKTNIVNREKGSFAALLGEAHQHIVAGILMRVGFFVSTFPVRGGTYDLIITAFKDRRRYPEEEVLVRTQSRTLRNSLKFTGGVRGGVDRTYLRPSPKEYKFTTLHNDLIIGIDTGNLDLFLVPTQLIEKWGKSVSKNKLQPLKNNFDVLLNWNEGFIRHLEKQL